MFVKEKAAQVAAYILWKCGSMTHLKLMKLMYLSERKYLVDFGARLTGDRLVSMPHGPVLSNTLDLFRDDPESIWDAWVKHEANRVVSLAKEIDSEDVFDLLSVAATKVIDFVIGQFGSLGAWELRNLTHTKELCPEWQDPHGSSLPIDLEEILRCSGKSKQEVLVILDDLKAQEEYQKIIGDMV